MCFRENAGPYGQRCGLRLVLPDFLTEDLYMSVPWDPAASPSILARKIGLTQHFQSAGLALRFPSNICQNTDLLGGCRLTDTYELSTDLQAQIKYIWPSKWTLVKIGFLMNRYLSLVALILLAVRVHALWGARRSIGIALGIVFACSTTSTLIAATADISGITRTVVVIKNLKVCLPTARLPRSYFVVWLPSLLFETVVFLMTMHKVIRPDRKEVRSIASLILRDGVVYFVTIFSARLVNMIVFIHRDPAVTYSGLFLLMGLGSTMVSRMTLNLRTWGVEETENPPVRPRRHLALSHLPHAISDRTSIPTPDMRTGPSAGTNANRACSGSRHLHHSDALEPKDDFAVLGSKDVIALKSIDSKV
ncbi:hypothetical protein BS47DRAFT_1392474 [Hydnum rufescens UP504]|uniref:DUF6533 domain-containing protein n=1 Tax=Hydnum rufescens UP504 TaxID=1448309 RepID=A0A9P6AZ88_9AGAM|nr:hypothetical protein BS47DRAFT_1392474 [Hydnum rufescens UP504]